MADCEIVANNEVVLLYREPWVKRIVEATGSAEYGQGQPFSSPEAAL